MSKLKLGVAGVAMLATSLLATPNAFAATEFGDGCAATGSAASESITIFQLSRPGNPLPSAAPSSGVITQLKVNSAYPVPVQQDLKVIRTEGTAARIVGSEAKTVLPGANSFPTRIPVQAGDLLGLYGKEGEGALFCEGNPKDVLLGAFGGDVPTGSSAPYITLVEPVSVPLVGVIEPDVDGDGYGDETQDGCPQSAAVHTPCPVVKLSLSKLVKKGSVKVLVSADGPAPVTVTGTVKVDGKKLRLKGGKKNLKAAKITAFTLSFPAELKAALKGLPASRALTLKIVASAKNAAGKASVKKLTARLKGQG
jgi:hypothetical protein